MKREWLIAYREAKGLSQQENLIGQDFMKKMINKSHDRQRRFLNERLL